jgi:hypothetical protein
MARRRVEVFSLSFLDVICCGFGAVILLFSVISARQGIERTANTESLAAEVARLEEEVIIGARNLVQLQNALEKTDAETVSAETRAAQLIEELQRQREESFIYDATTIAKRERIEKLKADIKVLEANRRTKELPQTVTPAKSRTLPAQRYITGLTIKGKRVLILFDRSASMLHDDYLEIFKLRNSPIENQLQESDKWRWATEIAAWLVAQVPEGSEYQLYVFNTTVEPLLSDTDGQWLSAKDAGIQPKLISQLGVLAPTGGTSLINALQAVRKMKLPPDQVILITDGLPTQGATTPVLNKYVKPTVREGYFDDAVRAYTLPAPVDVILLPMKGDLFAAEKYWGFARKTKGSFLTPSVDWP